jgi:kynurenine formamidase
MRNISATGRFSAAAMRFSANNPAARLASSAFFISACGSSFGTAGWIHGNEVAAVATDTWGFEVRPNEFEGAFQPLHQIAIPHMGLFLGELWDLDELAADCAIDGKYECLLVAGPIPFTGAVGGPVNPIAMK